MGYIARVGSAYNVTLVAYSTMQFVCLVLSPAFFSAGLYLTIGNLYLPSHCYTDDRAVIVGRANSHLKPMYYIIIFTTFDITALVVQAIGGNGAAKAQSDGKATDTPTHIMVCSQ